MHASLARRVLGRANARLALAVLLAGATLAGCSTRESASSDATALSDGAASLLAPRTLPGGFPPATWRGLGRSHMPLAMGSRWDYDVHTLTRIVSPGVPDALGENWHPWVTEVVGAQVIGDRAYSLVVEQDPQLRVVVTPLPMREDVTGLYQRDVIVVSAASGRPAPRDARAEAGARAMAAALARAPADPAIGEAAKRLEDRVARILNEGLEPDAASAGPDADEIALLRYPLHLGAKWDVRAVPRFTRRVLARDVSRVPAGVFTTWRIQGSGDLLGPNDRVYVWYAHEGLVHAATHVETEATDGNGNVIGRLYYDMDQTLTGIRFDPVRAF